MEELLAVMKVLVESQKVQSENQRLQEQLKIKFISQTITVPKRFIFIIKISDTEELEWRRKIFVVVEAIANSITEFKYCPEEGITFLSYFRSYAA